MSGLGSPGHGTVAYRPAVGENCLGELLKEQVAYYNAFHTRLSLERDCPEYREPQAEGCVYAAPGWVGFIIPTDDTHGVARNIHEP